MSFNIKKLSLPYLGTQTDRYPELKLKKKE